VSKSFNKPAEYAAVLERLARRHIHAITSFIFGMDNDTPGTAERTLEQIRSWPPGLPVFGSLTPFPSTPLYKRLADAGRLTRPKHWLDFRPFQMAHTPLKMSIEQTQTEINHAWVNSYSPEGIARAVNSIRHQPVGQRATILIARLCFRGIYFPQMGRWAWTKVIAQNWQTIYSLAKEGVAKRRLVRKDRKIRVSDPSPI